MTTGQKSQQSFKYDLFPSLSLSEKINIIESLPESHLLALGSLMRLDLKHQVLLPGQKTIGSWHGYCRKTINRAMKVLRAHEIIDMRRRYNNTCIYRLANWLYHPYVRVHLQSYFPFLRSSLFACMLCSIMPSEAQNKRGVPLLNKLGYIYNTSVQIYSNKANQPMDIELQREINGKEREYSPPLPTKIPESRRLIDPIPAHIRSFTALPLTLAGMAKLSGFNQQTIEALAKEIRQRRSYRDNLRDPYAYAFKFCHRYCTEHGFKYDSKYVNAIIQSMNIKAMTENLDMKKGLPAIEPFVVKKPTEQFPKKTYSRTKQYAEQKAPRTDADIAREDQKRIESALKIKEASEIKAKEFVASQGNCIQRSWFLDFMAKNHPEIVEGITIVDKK